MVVITIYSTRGIAVSTIDGDIQETKQKQQYMGEFKRPDISGRKFEPTFIFKKSRTKVEQI